MEKQVAPKASLHVAAALACLLPASAALAQWRTIQPGGDTVCSDGSPYRFFVYPADPGKLLVEFEGGGACWSGATCELDVYTRRITADPELARQQGLLQGIYDRTNPANPFRDYTHVYIPYCTGDLHWGNSATSYVGSKGGYVIQHRGAVNASTALSWTYDNLPAPSQLFVAGCSAGGYGAILWSAHILQHYPGASAAELSDSAAGVVPTGFFDTLMPVWGLSSAWPSFIPALDLSHLDTAHAGINDLYTGIASYYPLAAFSEFNTLADSTQTFFASLAQGGIVTPEDWSARMQASIATLRAQNPNFFAYTAPGSQHCIINRPEFYTAQVNGVRFVDWVKTLASTRSPGSVP